MFVKFAMNGADDVLKYQKWKGCSVEKRSIALGRPGDTEKLHKAVTRARIDVEQGYFIIGPELPDTSSSAVRKALRDGDTEALGGQLHPAVAEWCLSCGPYQPRHSATAAKITVAKIDIPTMDADSLKKVRMPNRDGFTILYKNGVN